MRLFKLCFLLAFVIVCNVSAREYDPEKLENVLEVISRSSGASAQIDEIESYIDDPIYLRDASIFEIAQLPGITSSHALKIKELIKRDSSDVSFNTLFDELRLSEAQLYILELCTTLDEKLIKHPELVSRLRTINKLQEVKGFDKSIFQGDKLDLYQRYNFNSDRVKAGLLLDKEPGELPIADFISVYASYKKGNTKIFLGDYYIEKGMGNILWKSFGLRKGANTVAPVVQMGSGIKEYRSSIDYLFFRGGAVETGFRFSDITVNASIWGSHAPRSARIDTNGFATSIHKTGLYRYGTEINKKNKLMENNLGGSIEISSGNFMVGATSFWLGYDHEITSTSVSNYNGKEGFLKSGYISYFTEKYTVGGEVSEDGRGNYGAKAGAQFLFDWIDIGLAYRRFDKDYRTPFGYNFGESQSPANEEGIYLGCQLNFSPNFQIAMYADKYKSLGATYYVPGGIEGLDLFSEFLYRFDPANIIKLRVQRESKTDRRKQESDDYATYDRTRLNVRLDYEGRIVRGLNYRLRLDGVMVDFEDYFEQELGLVGFAELKYQVLDDLGIGGRLTKFSTDSYESAIWQYEAIFPGYTISQPLYLNGTRYYLFIKYSPIKHLTLRIRYTMLTKFNVEKLGSGYDEIIGSEDNRVYFQIDFTI